MKHSRQLSQTDTAEYEHFLATVYIRVTLPWRREDQILPVPYGQWSEQHIPSQGITWVDNAGHLLTEDAPAQLLERLTRQV